MRVVSGPSQPFVGRGEELSRLREALEHQGIVLLQGPAGVGKTSLLLSFLHESRGLDPSALLLYVRCLPGWSLEDVLHEIHSGLDAADAERLGHLLKASGGPGTGPRQKLALLAGILGERRALLCLDDFHVLEDDDLETFVELLREQPSVRVVLASREPFPLPRPLRQSLAEEPLHGLAPAAARQLLDRLLAPDLPPADRETVLDLAQGVDGHPLLLTWLATQARSLSQDVPPSPRAPSQDAPTQARSLSQDVPTQARSLSQDAPPSPRAPSQDVPTQARSLSQDAPPSLRAPSQDAPRPSAGPAPDPALASRLVDHLLARVDSRERGVLEAVALSRVPLPESAVIAVEGERGLEGACARLEQARLLERDGQHNLSVPSLLRERLVHDLGPTRATSLHRSLGTWFEQAGKTGTAFHHLLLAGEAERAADILAAASSRLCAEGHFQALVRQTQRLEEAGVEVGPRLGLAKGNALSVLGRWEQSLDTLKAVVSRAPDRTLLGDALLSKAGVYLNVGDLRRALDLYQRALEGFQETHDAEKLAKCLNYMAFIHGLRGELTRGRRMTARSLLVCEDGGVVVGRAQALRMRAYMHAMAGEFDDAVRTGLEAIEGARESGSARLVCWARDVVARGHAGRRDLDTAKKLFEENLEKMSSLGDNQGVAFSHLGLGQVARERDSIAGAIAHFVSSSRHFSSQGNLLGEAIAVHHQLHTILFTTEDADLDDVAERLDKTLWTATEFEHFLLEARIRLDLAELEMRQGQWHEAESQARKAQARLERLDVPRLQSEAILMRACSAHGRHEDVEARRLADEAMVGAAPRTARMAAVLLEHLPDASSPPHPPAIPEVEGWAARRLASFIQGLKVARLRRKERQEPAPN